MGLMTQCVASQHESLHQLILYQLIIFDNHVIKYKNFLNWSKMNANLDLLTVAELKNLAQQTGLSDYSRRDRNDLIALLQQIITSISNPKIPEQALSETNLGLLPHEIQLELLSQMDLPELQKICTGNKQLQKLCQPDQFWEFRIKRDYPNRPKGNLTWRENYIKAYQSDKLNDLISLHHNPWQFMNIHLREFTKGTARLVTPGIQNIKDANLAYYVQNLIDLAASAPLGPTPEQSQLINNFYLRLTNLEILNSILDAPIPNVHSIKFNLVNRYTQQQLSNKVIDKYDISLRDIFDMLITIKHETGGEYLNCYDIGQYIYQNVLYLRIEKRC